MNLHFKTNITPQEHDAFVSNHPYCNLLQSSKWAQIKCNWDHALVGIKDDQDSLVASCLVLIKPLPLGFTMFYIPKGPILDFSNEKLVHFFFEELKKFAKTRHCLFVKFDTGVLKNSYHLDEKTDDILPESQQVLDLLKQCGCVHLGFSTDMAATIQPRFQAPVFFDENFEDHLPRHTKRHIATARKKFVEVSTFGSEMIPEFARLMKLTEERKNVALRNEDYFELLMNTYGEDARIYLAHIDLNQLLEETIKRKNKAEKDLAKCKPEEEKKIDNFTQTLTSAKQEIKDIEQFKQEDGDHPYIAAALTVFYGSTAEMLYMGMDGKYRKYMAPYLSHLTPMLDAFSRGCEKCNMGGLEGTLDGGLTKFKANFNPVVQEYLGEFELPVNSFLYHLAHTAFNVRKKLINRK